MANPVRNPLRRDEAIANHLVQCCGLVTALVGCIFLLRISVHLTSTRLVVSIVLYSIGLLTMLASSTIYHVKFCSPNRHFYRSLDHIAIFVMIAGTYSPITLGAIGGILGLILFCLAWTVALGGITVRLMAPALFQRIGVYLYLALGWMILPMLPHMIATMPTEGVLLIAAGAIVYTLGVPFHRWECLRFHDAIWHSFVVTAAALHYTAILRMVVLSRA